MASEQTVPKVLSTSQAAALCRVDRRTMLRWVKARKLPSHETGGGWRRILRDDLLHFMSKRGIPLPGSEGADIVVADDDRSHVSALCRLIEVAAPDVRVVAAYDGFAAGLHVARLRPSLLFLDIVMPGLDGADVCRQVRGDPSLSGTAIVVVSGVLDTALIAKLTKLGAERCLRKPAKPDDIVGAIRDFVPRVSAEMSGVAS
jgi:excisionase family DNA binding protein